MYKLSKEQEDWASKSKQYIRPKDLRTLIVNQKGRCNLTNVKMLFNKATYGTPGGGKGVHPLYASVDHINPKSKGKRSPNIGDVQLLCYAINDMKGHMPFLLFNVILDEEKEWNKFKTKWQRKKNRKQYYYLIP